MIVPLKKVSFIIRENDKTETLKKLRKLGILHIEAVEGSGKKLAELKERVALFERALFSVTDKKNKKIMHQDIDSSQALTICQEIASLEEEKKQCTSKKLSLIAESERISGWGDINPCDISALCEKGIDVSLYEMPVAEYEKLDDSVKTISLEKTKNSVKFILVKSRNVGEDETVASIKSYRLEIPSISTAEIKDNISEIEARIDEIDEKISSYASLAQTA